MFMLNSTGHELLIQTKIPTNKDVSGSKSRRYLFVMLIHVNIYEQDTFCAQLYA